MYDLAALKSLKLKMNRTQRNVLLIGILLILLMLIFPPWKYFDGNTSDHTSAGYHFFRTPPPLKSAEEIFGMSGWIAERARISVHLDAIRLIAQLLIVAPITLGLLLLLKDRRETIAKIYGQTFLGAGIAMLILYSWMWLYLANR
jgi:hypothetical protein